MATAWNGFPGPARRRPFGALALIGLVAIFAGTALPRLFGDATLPPPQPAPPRDAPLQNFQYVPPSWPDSTDPRAMLGRLVFGTVIVLMLIVLFLYLGRRWLQPPPKVEKSKHLHLIESLGLDVRSQLHLVDVDGRLVLVGTDAAGFKAMLPLTPLFEQALQAATGPAEETTAVPGA